MHPMYSADPETPWRGAGPLQVAQLAGRLSAETVAALADEASGPRGSLLPLPVDGDDTTVSDLKADIRGLKGQTAIVEGGDWASSSGDMARWEAMRLGADPPAALVEQLAISTAEVYAACGINPAVFRDCSRHGWPRGMAAGPTRRNCSARSRRPVRACGET